MARQLIKIIALSTIITIFAANHVSAKQTTEPLKQNFGCRPIHTTNELGKQLKVGSYCVDSSESQSENTKFSKFTQCQEKSVNIRYFINENFLPQVSIPEAADEKDNFSSFLSNACGESLTK